MQLSQYFEQRAARFTHLWRLKNQVLAKMRPEQQIDSTNCNVGGTGMIKHLCFPLLLILHYLYYSDPQVYGGNGNLIKRLLKSMKTLTFIALP